MSVREDAAHNRLDRTPTWLVQEVFDPDVTGQDFSYTIGLHDHGLPELHMWASPTDGDDPGMTGRCPAATACACSTASRSG